MRIVILLLVILIAFLAYYCWDDYNKQRIRGDVDELLGLQYSPLT